VRWQLIVDRLKELGQLERYEEIIPVKDWSSSGMADPATCQEDLNCDRNAKSRAQAHSGNHIDQKG